MARRDWTGRTRGDAQPDDGPLLLHTRDTAWHAWKRARGAGDRTGSRERDTPRARPPPHASRFTGYRRSPAPLIFQMVYTRQVATPIHTQLGRRMSPASGAAR